MDHRLSKANIAATLGLLVVTTLLTGQVAAGNSDNGIPNTTARSALQSSAQPYQPPATPAPGDWPMYGHDVSRTNYNPDETLLNSGNVAQMVQRWQVDIGGGTIPSGGPSVAGGKVYIGNNGTSGNNFFAYDAVNGGAPLWSTIVGHGPETGCGGIHIGSTSAISGTILSVGGGDSAYYGLNANTGAQLWRNDMNVGRSGFPWVSPLLANGMSYVGIASGCDDPSVRGEVRAINEVTGQQVANQYFVPAGEAGAGIWNSPALDPKSNTLVVVTGEDYSGYNGPYNRAMISLNPLTLQILQSYQEGDLNNDLDFGTTPIVFHDAQGRTLVAANHKNGTFYTYVLNDINSGPIWQRATGTDVGMMPAYDPTFGNGGTLFIEGGGARLYAVDPATGQDRWPDIGVSSYGNLAIANGLIFVNDGGTLKIFNETDGSHIRDLPGAASGGSYSGVAVSNGFVYWLSGTRLNAWSLPAGTPVPTSTSTSVPTATGTTIPLTFTPTSVPTSTNTAVPLTSSATATATGIAPTSTGTAAATATATGIAPTSTGTAAATATATGIAPTSTGTAVATNTGTITTIPTTTETVVATSTAQATVCTIIFTDVPPDSTFYSYIECLACRGIVNGYECGGPGEPCDSNGDGYFRPGNQVTRGQLSKIVSNSAGYDDTPAGVTYQDVPANSTFYIYIERLTSRGFMGGYECGGPGEPCVPPGNKPYFRPNANATRGQLSKIVSNARGFNEDPGQQVYEDVPPGSAFYDYINRLTRHGVIGGYECGGPGEPCVPPSNKPYFRPFNNATRGQTSKIDSITFFPECNSQARR